MHYSNLVIIEKTLDIRSAVEAAMGAKDEAGGFWDWYQIGGRWSGTLDGYDPEKDEANQETCDLCKGTGTRKDMIVANGCNGCIGKGKRVKWPTQWADHGGDVAPIESLSDEAYDKFYRIVTQHSRVFGGEQYLPWKPSGEMFPKNERPPLDWLKQEYSGHLIVVVDNHN